MFYKSKEILCFLLFTILLVLLPFEANSFGWEAHRKINRMAVFTLPPDIMPFYRQHIEYLTERSIDPDRRAHAVPGESQRHYIDIDHFGEDPFDIMPKEWDDAVEKFTEDTLQEYGVLPWHMDVMMDRLTNAFKAKDVDRILYNSAHLGHYIADALTPLHTTVHYNGRTPEQRGIHGLWESRLPELYADEYDYFVGRAEYIDSQLERIWELIEESHKEVETVFEIYDHLYETMPSDLIYSHEMRGQSYVRPYSRTFSKAFHDEMDCMVERKMQLSVKSVGDFWYTAWIDAGQPDIDELLKKEISEAHQEELEELEEEYEGIDESEYRESRE